MRTSEVLRHLRQQQATPGARPRLLHRYAAFLPLTDATPPLSLGEGATPLVHARNLGRELGIPELYLKVEGTNPTGSFKDRGMVLAVAKALEAGARAIICASTGNTSASAAAYGAAVGLEVIVVLPAGRIAARQARPGPDGRRARGRDRRQLRRRACASCARWPSRAPSAATR